ncbi:hypothetical protein JAAARDRAFT_210774 [Jaapia argillacea MUCL 33604]|uniref:Uncharacterized protein n=1 Tax=Jaapia argillacea MUCL 33604 TaxID=933084 RepID=A0A067PAS9_9AGAM|nr:hypothetical protein JAAARDRAFT_210774 [Jaapia argillacea MUCL 33604]
MTTRHRGEDSPFPELGRREAAQEAIVHCRQYLLAQAEAQLASIRAERATFSLIYRLPTETLSAIFELADQEDEKNYNDGYASRLFKNNLRKVSRRFRNVAITTPSLWARIIINLGHEHDEPQPTTGLNWVECHLDRSSSHLLDVHFRSSCFCAEDRSDMSTAVRITHALLPHVFRLRRLAIHIDEVEACFPFFNALRPLSAPRLEVLTISGHEENLRTIQRSLDENGFHSIFEAGTPRLCRIALSRLLMVPFANPLPPLHLVTEVRIEGCQMWYWVDDIRQLLTGIPLLASLMLSHVFLRDHGDPEDQWVIPTHSLTSLEISNCQAEWVVKVLDAPSLLSLSISGTGYLYEDIVQHISRTRKFPSLRSLSLNDHYGDCKELSMDGGLFRSTPLLQKLDLRGSHLVQDLLLQSLQGDHDDGSRGAIPWPHLRSLSLSHTTRETLRAFLAFRLATSVPILELAWQLPPQWAHKKCDGASADGAEVLEWFDSLKVSEEDPAPQPNSE